MIALAALPCRPHINRPHPTEEVPDDQESCRRLQSSFGERQEESRRSLQNKEGSGKAPEASGILQTSQRLVRRTDSGLSHRHFGLARDAPCHGSSCLPICVASSCRPSRHIATMATQKPRRNRTHPATGARYTHI